MNNIVKINSINSEEFNSNNDVIIGVDLDGVCVKTRPKFIRLIERDNNVLISDEQLESSMNPSLPQVGSDFRTQVRKIVDRDFSIYKKFPPMDGAKKYISKLEKKYNIKIITHRVLDEWHDKRKTKRMAETTEEWLNDNNISYNDFVYPTPVDKTEVNADIYIDDNPSVIKNIQNHKNKMGIVFLRPHNVDLIVQNRDKYEYNISEKKLYEMSKNPEKQWSLISRELLPKFRDN